MKHQVKIITYFDNHLEEVILFVQSQLCFLSFLRSETNLVRHHIIFLEGNE